MHRRRHARVTQTDKLSFSCLQKVVIKINLLVYSQNNSLSANSVRMHARRIERRKGYQHTVCTQMCQHKYASNHSMLHPSCTRRAPVNVEHPIPCLRLPNSNTRCDTGCEPCVLEQRHTLHESFVVRGIRCGKQKTDASRQSVRDEAADVDAGSHAVFLGMDRLIFIVFIIGETLFCKGVFLDHLWSPDFAHCTRADVLHIHAWGFQLRFP